ncbi:MAG: hypothetical protein WA005_16810 [Candidatus Binataceae bacterium]
MTEGLVAEILGLSGKDARRQVTVSETGGEAVRSLAQRDYGLALRKNLSRCEAQEILAVAQRKVWPHLNRRAGRLASLKEFASEWSKLGIECRGENWSWPEGLELLGFYIHKTKGVIDHPLIFVNTAHHPAVVAAALDHEMGHHLTAQIFASRKEPAHLSPGPCFADHLDDPMELAADMLVSIAVYPQATARKTFDNSGKGGCRERLGSQGLADAEFAKVLNDIATHYGLNFGANFQPEKKVQLLAGLFHCAKLRCALLDEYGV